MKSKHQRAHGSSPSPFDPDFTEALNRSSGRSFKRDKPDHKTRQLCRQVQRALSLALAGECGDDLLRELYVADVTPAPDAGHLLVSVALPPGAEVAAVLEHLGGVSARLRGLVAQAITRKRAPELSFMPVAMEVGNE